MDDKIIRWKTATDIHNMPKYHHKDYLQVTKRKGCDFTMTRSCCHLLNKEFSVNITNSADIMGFLLSYEVHNITHKIFCLITQHHVWFLIGFLFA